MIGGSTVWDRVLLAALCAVLVYALVMVGAGLALAGSLFEVLGFGLDDGDISGEEARRYARLIFAVLGSVIAGWMLTLGALVLGPLARREPWAWTTIAVSVGTWFILDTAMSLVLGFAGHALFNVGFPVVLATPLISIRADLAETAPPQPSPLG